MRSDQRRDNLSGMARGLHSLTATHTFIHEWIEPSCIHLISINQMAPPSKVAHVWISFLLIYQPQKDERLSWPSWLTLQRMVYSHKWSPISYRSSVGQGKFAGRD